MHVCVSPRVVIKLVSSTGRVTFSQKRSNSEVPEGRRQKTQRLQPAAKQKRAPFFPQVDCSTSTPPQSRFFCATGSGPSIQISRAAIRLVCPGRSSAYGFPPSMPFALRGRVVLCCTRVQNWLGRLQELRPVSSDNLAGPRLRTPRFRFTESRLLCTNTGLIHSAAAPSSSSPNQLCT